jgi:hypothetical protein
LTAPWKSHPKRMLRHKALIQAARIAFSFAGIFDQDEAERIVEAEVIDVTPGQEVIPGNGKVAPKKLREVVEGMNAAVKAGEAVKAHAIWSQLSNDQILFVWGTLQSWEKSAIKKMQDSPGYKAAANGIDLDAWCFETLRGCKDLAAVEKAYASIQEAYADIDLEVPLDLQTARTDRKAELGASQ